ncbi:AraC family transcriptional regulator [Thauera sp. Sel9]|uniref:AraC family transcriptional regulator n=1 Tax=Thauera sp. Sel9 TaxID=2974299 RepID=UPI0021E1274D|nr:AraC family transcriptional regulator [Thauera sp. Sel9]MCV2217969.1 AraC family transcriptional regulator [Thauera sp. Sel9]
MESAIYASPPLAGADLPGFELFQTSDIEEARQWGARVFCENRLSRLDTRKPIHTRMYYRRLRGLGVGRMSYGGEVAIDPGTLDSFVLVQMPLRGREIIETGGETLCSTLRTASVLNAHLPVQIRHESDTEKLVVRIDRDVLERYCIQHLGQALRAPITFRPTMALDTAAGQRWMRLMTWLHTNLTEDEGLHSPLIAAQTEQMVITMLLTCQAHNYSEALTQEDRSIAPAFVKRIEHYIEEHANEPITILDLAEHANVSTRSMFTGFRRFRNTTPMLYLKEVRMRRVNEELKRLMPGESTVTAVAFRWGFNHLGHFTTDYKRRFGESPSETLAR